MATEVATASELPTKYRACAYDNPGSISTKVVELDMPEPGFGEVLVNLTHSGVCHSDFGVMMNSWKGLPFPTQTGQVGGHEGVGKVVKLGQGAETSNLKIGDRVGIKWVASACGHCQPCMANSDGICFNQRISGYYWPGTFQQYALAPARYVTPIPDGLDSAAAAPMLCAGLTTYSAMKKANAHAGDWVVVSGSGGGLGHLACQLGARAFGYRIIGVDDGSKEAITMESGAEHFVDISKFPRDDGGKALVDHVKALAGGLGAHAVIICTAANPAFSQGLQFLRFNGTLVPVGIPEGDHLPIASANPFVLITQQLKIAGSCVGNRQEAIETLEFAARGILKTHYVTEKMENLTEVFEKMHKGQIQGRVVLSLE